MKLGRTHSHRKATLANMASTLILHERILTTRTKAKALKRFIEPLVTRAKNNTLANKRIVLSRLFNNRKVMSKLFDVIAPRYIERPGGYTRIINYRKRMNDNAEQSFIEFVEGKGYSTKITMQSRLVKGAGDGKASGDAKSTDSSVKKTTKKTGKGLLGGKKKKALKKDETADEAQDDTAADGKTKVKKKVKATKKKAVKTDRKPAAKKSEKKETAKKKTTKKKSE